MAKYRIVKHWDRDTQYFYYHIQKKILGLYWWTVNTSLYQDFAEYRLKLLLEPKIPDEVIAEYGT